MSKKEIGEIEGMDISTKKPQTFELPFDFLEGYVLNGGKDVVLQLLYLDEVVKTYPDGANKEDIELDIQEHAKQRGEDLELKKRPSNNEKTSSLP